MLLRNLDSKLINGSRGIIVKFVPIEEDTMARLTKEKDIPARYFAKNKFAPLVRFAGQHEMTVIYPEVFTAESRREGIAYRAQSTSKVKNGTKFIEISI